MTPEHQALLEELGKLLIAENKGVNVVKYLTRLSVILEADEAALAQARSADPNTPLIPVIIP